MNYMKAINNIRFFLCAAVSILMVFTCNTIDAQNSRHILIIDSYDGNINWANQLIDTVISKVKDQYGSVDFTRIELKSNQNRKHLPVYIDKTNMPNIVLAIGEEAESFLKSHNDSAYSFDNIPKIIVSKNTSFAQGCTGVRFDIPAKENIELIHKAIPNLKEILYIDDNYIRSDIAIDLIRKEIEKQNLKVKFTVIRHDSTNDDNELADILDNKPDRAIITYAWDFRFRNSSFDFTKIDSLLTNKTTSPIFSMTDLDYNNSYIVGGYNYSTRMGAEKVTDQIIKVLKGSAIKDIPSETLKNGNIILNKSAIKYYALEDTTNGFFEVEYTNVPSSFSFQNKKMVAFILIAALILVFLLYMIIKYIRTNKHDSEKLKEYKKKYDVLEKIYNKSKIYFAVYDNMGNKQFDITGDESDENVPLVIKYIPENLFKASYISNEDKDNIRNKRECNLRINDGDSYIKIIVKPLLGSINSPYKYSLSITIEQLESNNEDQSEHFYKLINEISDIFNLGIATYNIFTGKGHATKNWYDNLGEKDYDYQDNLIPKYNFISAKDKAEITDFIKNVIDGKATEFQKEIQVTTNDPITGKDKVKWVKNYIILKNYYPSTQNISLIDFNYDITENKHRETKFELFNTKAREAYKYSTDFINSINHEIRTPLTSIIGFSKMLINDQNAGNNEIINIIKRNNVLLIELINNILSLANIDSGNYNLNKTDLNLNDIFKDLKIATVHMLTTEKLLTSKNIEIIIDTPDTPHTINTDEWNFRQVMINLLSNAVKFTSNGTIVFGYQIHDNSTYFYVKDTGCGIAQQNLDKIFNRFEKLDAFTAGNGLGLSLCKSIITLLGGEIGVTSSEGEGSTFWFTLK